MQQVTQFSNLPAQYIISKLEYYLQKSLYRNQNASSVKLVNKKLKKLFNFFFCNTVHVFNRVETEGLICFFI